MKKLSFFFALFAMFFLNVGLAKGETATIAYSGATTNMTGGNDAALVGLDASMWSVVSNKGGANNHVGLNKAGNIRLYAHKDSGNGNILTVSISQGTIEEITLNIKQTAKYTVKAAGIEVTATEGDTYAIGANTFSIQNITTGESTQLHLNSITITYTSTGEGGGDTPDTPDTPVTGTEITGIQGADATYVADEEFGDYWVFDLYASIDEAEGMYMSPYLYVETYKVYGKTTLNGTYNIYYAEYWKNENEEDIVNTDEMAEEPVGTLTIKNKDNNGNYSFVGSFVGLDGKTYTLNQVVPVTAYEYLGQDEDGYDIYEDLTLSENGNTPDTDDMLTCAEAATIAAAENYQGTEEVTVYGYVVELGSQKVDDTTGRNKQTFWLSDKKGGEKQFQAYWAYVPDFFEVGDKVAVTGILKNYKGTIEIVDGEATLLSDTSVEDVLVGETPIKMIKNGQLVIIRGENTYNVLGAQVK
jgi:hypothetical protein